MTAKTDRETEARVREAICDEPVLGIDLEAHAHNVVVDVARRRAATKNQRLHSDLADDLLQRTREKPSR